MEKQVYTVTVTKNETQWRNAQGQFHRLDGPAREWADGTKIWYQNGQLHRLNGPASEWADGSKEWCQNGQYHRLDGPAVERASGSKAWCQNGKLHRLDGPARELSDGDKQWWINGQQLTEREFRMTSKELLAKTSTPKSNKVTGQEVDRIVDGVNGKSRAATKFHLEMVKKTTGEILLEDVEYCMNLSVRVEAYSKKTGTSHF